MSGRTPGKIRIVSGADRGRRIAVPDGTDIRPTSEMVREAIFDVLGPVCGSRVVDLFAGTGALGMEALSRGAMSCLFVDADPKVAKGIRENLGVLGYERVSQVVVGDYRLAVEAMQASGEACDLLFVDPPYRMLAEVEAALAPMLPALLAPKGLMVVEGPRTTKVTFGQDPLFEREYGDTRITMFRAKE